MTMLYITLRGQSDNIVLNMYAPTGDKSDDKKKALMRN
jgi:hypothetical protein